MFRWNLFLVARRKKNFLRLFLDSSNRFDKNGLLMCMFRLPIFIALTKSKWWTTNADPVIG